MIAEAAELAPPAQRAPQGDAYLVEVDLAVLARDLERRTGGKATERDAADWLTRTHRHAERDAQGNFHEPSPFSRTDVHGTFYSREDPRTWLMREEIIAVRAARMCCIHVGTTIVVDEVEIPE